jgi:tetratricopeptide (TPR) repeat protein
MSNYLINALVTCEEILLSQTENTAQWEMNCRKIGNILQSMGWFDEALLWHSRLLEHEHNLVAIYQDLALLYTRLEKWENAISSYEKILKINPDHAETYLKLSKIHGHVGDEKAEIECLFHVLTLQPEKVKPDAYYKLGKEFKEINNYERAITCYLRSLDNSPHILPAYDDLAEIYIKQDHWEKAIDIYHRLLEQDDQQAIAHYNIGQLWWQQEKYPEALEAYLKAALIEPKLAQSYHDLAVTLVTKNQLNELIKFCRSLLMAKILYPWIYVQLGNTLVKKEQFADASLCYQQAAKLRGWTEAVTNNYQFTKDFFNHKIPLLETYLQPLSNQPLINALEIASGEGNSTCWLLDKILTQPTAKLTCIDSEFSELFNDNITKTGANNKVIKLDGYIPKILEKLEANFFDLVNIQDKVKKPSRIREIAELCWLITKKGGLIIFNDYQSEPKFELEGETPKTILDNFLGSNANNLEILYQNKQLIIKKIN